MVFRAKTFGAATTCPDATSFSRLVMSADAKMSLGAPDRICVNKVDDDPKLRRTFNPLLSLRNCTAKAVNASVSDEAAEIVNSPLSFDTSALGVAFAALGTNEAITTPAIVNPNRFILSHLYD
jgi:hypothetical protein